MSNNFNEILPLLKKLVLELDDNGFPNWADIIHRAISLMEHSSLITLESDLERQNRYLIERVEVLEKTVKNLHSRLGIHLSSTKINSTNK